MSSNVQPSDLSWHIAQRWQQYEGEARANLLRIITVGTFYLLHLWNYFSSQGKLPSWGFLQLAEVGKIDRRFHVMATFLALAWITLAAGVHFALQDRVFPRWLPTVTTLCDVVFLTCVLCISNGPRSPLVVGYFLILAAAALRFSLSLIRLIALATIVGYLAVLGCAKWPTVFGRSSEVELTIPRFHQLVVIVALALTGIVLGQIIRCVRNLTMGSWRQSKDDGESIA